MIGLPASASGGDRVPSRARLEVRALVAVSIISLIALALRLCQVSAPTITPDEWFSLRIAREGLLWLLGLARDFEPHPPLFSFGFVPFVSVAGESELAMRFLPVAFGVLTVPVGFALGHALLDTRAGLVAASMLAINPYMVAQAQNARSYTMIILLVMLSTYFLVLAIKSSSRRHWVAYALASIAMLYTHYNAGFILLAHGTLIVGGCVLSRRWRSIVLRPWAGAVLAMVGLFGPWVVYVLPLLTSYRGFYPEPIAPLTLLQRTLVAYSAGQQETGVLASTLALAMVALACIGFGFAWRKNVLAAAVTGLCVVVPVVVAIVVFAVRPMFEERYLIVLAPAFILLAAFGIVAVSRAHRLLGAVAFMVVVCGCLYHLIAYYPWVVESRNDHRSMAQWIEVVGRSGDVIVATGNSVAELFSYYYEGSLPLVVAADQERTEALLSEVLSQRPTGIWHLPYCDTSADLIATDILSRRGFATEGHWFRGVQAKYYALDSGTMATQTVDAVWADHLRLSGRSLDPLAVEPGDVLRVALRWEALAQIDQDYKVSLRLRDRDGAVITQLDRRPVNGLAPTSGWEPGESIVDNYGLMLPLATAPGSYKLELVVYDDGTGREVPVRVASGSPLVSVELGKVDVRPATRPTPVALLDASSATTAFATDLTLVNHSLAATGARSGEAITVSILWRAPIGPEQDYVAQLELLDAAGQSVGLAETPVGGDHPTSDWIAGEAIRQYFHVPIAPQSPGGPHRLVLRLIDGQGQRLPVAGGEDGGVYLGEVEVIAANRNFEAPEVALPLKATFGGYAQLIGYDLSPPRFVAGEVGTVTLFWQGLAPSDRSYTVFVHLLDRQQRVRGQRDQIPLSGERPTTSWLAGEYLVDSYELMVDPSTEPGEYSLEIGLYDAQTGERLLVRDDTGAVSGDRLLLPGLVVE